MRHNMLYNILLSLAIIFAAFAAFGWPTEGRVKFGWLALFCYFLALAFSGPLAPYIR